MGTLGDRIKLLRDKLKQEELANLLQVERSTLASWEVNRREPDIATLRRIASFFNVSIDWLVGHESNGGYSQSKLSQVQEVAAEYQFVTDTAWQAVIKEAQYYGYDPNAVQQLLEVNAKIALSINVNKTRKMATSD